MTQVLILAAGRGVRMNNTAPKVLMPIAGKPMILHLLEAVERAGICPQPALVVGHKAAQVREVVGSQCRFIEQKKQLGTGHAVQICAGVFDPRVTGVLVLNGDHPFIRPETICQLAEHHEATGSVITMMTTLVEDFNDWRAPFEDFGRVLREKSGSVVAVVERKDATEPVLALREVNPGLFCFNTPWLWENIGRLTNRNAAREYYLPDLIALAIRDGLPIATLSVDPFEGLGINTPEQLELAERLFTMRMQSPTTLGH